MTAKKKEIFVNSCYFCDRPAEKCLSVAPEPKEKGCTFVAGTWLQPFCNEHWKFLMKSKITDLTKPIERSDLLVKVNNGGA